MTLPDSKLDICFWAMPNPISFSYLKTSPDILQLAAIPFLRFPLSLRNVEYFIYERGVDVIHQSVGTGDIGYTFNLNFKPK
jgi:hypothetical protein